MSKHPIQPLVDCDGITRFKANAIVVHLLENGGIDMNDIAMLDVSREDREQFAQLIGYSWSGACGLNYVSDEVLDAALLAKESDLTGDAARAHALRERLSKVQRLMRAVAAELFSVHPDDLKGYDT